jgi:hypothetical protein
MVRCDARLQPKEESSWKNVENNSNVVTAGKNSFLKKLQQVTKKPGRSDKAESERN